MQSVVPDEINLHGFADDHVLKNSFRASSRVDEKESIRSLESTLVKVKTWMDQNRLKMNERETEFYYVCIKETIREVCNNQYGCQ